MSESICRLTPLIISDLIDEDRMLNNRKQNYSATIVGTNNFLGKFSQTLAPLFGYFVLHKQQRLVYIIVVPFICVSMQLYLWITFFKLEGKRLKDVKEYLKSNV